VLDVVADAATVVVDDVEEPGVVEEEPVAVLVVEPPLFAGA